MRNLILTALLATSVAMPAMAQDDRDGGAVTATAVLERRAKRAAPAARRTARSEPNARRAPKRRSASSARRARSRNAPIGASAAKAASARSSSGRRASRPSSSPRCASRASAVPGPSDARSAATRSSRNPYVAPTRDRVGQRPSAQRYSPHSRRLRHARRDGPRARRAPAARRPTAPIAGARRRAIRAPAGSGATSGAPIATTTGAAIATATARCSGLGNYRDPYGSRYRRFSIGFSLFPSYYQSNYWLDDPLHVSPAAGLRPVPLGALLWRCVAGEHLHRPGGRRGARLLLVSAGRSFVENRASRATAAPLLVYGKPTLNPIGLTAR